MSKLSKFWIESAEENFGYIAEKNMKRMHVRDVILLTIMQILFAIYYKE